MKTCVRLANNSAREDGINLCIHLGQGYLEGSTKRVCEQRKVIARVLHLDHARAPSMLPVNSATLALMRATLDSMAVIRSV